MNSRVVKIKDEEHSRKVQEKLFEMGYKWRSNNTKVSHTEAPFLSFYPNEKYICFGESNDIGREEWFLPEEKVTIDEY